MTERWIFQEFLRHYISLLRFKLSINQCSKRFGKSRLCQLVPLLATENVILLPISVILMAHVP